MTTQLSAKILYEQDYSLWIEEIVKQLKERDLKHLDWDNLIEEIESLGRSDKRELTNRLTVLLEHLLKLTYWESEKPFSGAGWRRTVKEQRIQIEKVLEESPSLKRYLIETFEKCYQNARYQAASENFPMETLPIDCPFILEQVMNRDYLP